MTQVLTGEACQSHGCDTRWCVGPAMPRSWTHIHITVAVFQITSANHSLPAFSLWSNRPLNGKQHLVLQSQGPRNMGIGVWKAIVGSYNLCCILPHDVIGYPHVFSKTVCNSLYFQINHPLFHWLAGLHFKKDCICPIEEIKIKENNWICLGELSMLAGHLLQRCTRCMHAAGIQEQQHVPCSFKAAYSFFLILLVDGVRTNHCRGDNCVFNSALTAASCEGQGIHWVRLLWKSSGALLSWHTTFTALYDAETELGVQRGWAVGG